MKPVKTFGPYVFTFTPEPEDISMRRHFVKECGWPESQYRKIEDFEWFCARVDLWRAGDVEPIATAYLGACCYETADEFTGVYAPDYFADMCVTAAREAADPALLAQVEAWRGALRAPAVEAARNAWAKARTADKPAKLAHALAMIRAIA